MKTLSLLLAVLMFNEIKSECLSKEILEGLGFTGVLEAPEILDQNICRGLFKSHGACVDPESVKTLIEQKRQEIDDALDREEEVEGVATTLEEAAPDAEAVAGIEQTVEDFKETKDKCSKAMDKVNMGVLCLLASGKGNEWATQNGTEIVVRISENTAETETEPCRKTLNAICLASTGTAALQEVSVDDSDIRSEDSSLNEDCKKIGEKGAGYLKKFSPDKMRKRIPSKDKLKAKAEKLKAKKDKLKDKIKKNKQNTTEGTGDAQPARRLQSTYTIGVEPTSDGADVVAYGEDSGVENTISIFYSTFVCLLYVLF